MLRGSPTFATHYFRHDRTRVIAANECVHLNALRDNTLRLQTDPRMSLLDDITRFSLRSRNGLDASQQMYSEIWNGHAQRTELI